jgi:hypothetical protein
VKDFFQATIIHTPDGEAMVRKEFDNPKEAFYFLKGLLVQRQRAIEEARDRKQKEKR